jgi:hypothetical protein
MMFQYYIEAPDMNLHVEAPDPFSAVTEWICHYDLARDLLQHGNVRVHQQLPKASWTILQIAIEGYLAAHGIEIPKEERPWSDMDLPFMKETA